MNIKRKFEFVNTDSDERAFRIYVLPPDETTASVLEAGDVLKNLKRDQKEHLRAIQLEKLKRFG